MLPEQALSSVLIITVGSGPKVIVRESRAALQIPFPKVCLQRITKPAAVSAELG